MYVAVRESEDWVDTYQGGVFSTPVPPTPIKSKNISWTSSQVGIHLSSTVYDAQTRTPSSHVRSMLFPTPTDGNPKLALPSQASQPISCYLLAKVHDWCNGSCSDHCQVRVWSRGDTGNREEDVWRAARLAKKSVIKMEMMFSQEAFLGSLCIRYVSGRASRRST